MEPLIVFAKGEVGWDDVEVRGEDDRGRTQGGVDQVASGFDREALDPVADAVEERRHEVDDGAFVAGGRWDSDQVAGQRNGIDHPFGPEVWRGAALSFTIDMTTEIARTARITPSESPVDRWIQ